MSSDLQTQLSLAMQDAVHNLYADPETAPRVLSSVRRRRRKTRGVAALGLAVAAALTVGAVELEPWRGIDPSVLNPGPDTAQSPTPTNTPSPRLSAVETPMVTEEPQVFAALGAGGGIVDVALDSASVLVLTDRSTGVGDGKGEVVVVDRKAQDKRGRSPLPGIPVAAVPGPDGSFWVASRLDQTSAAAPSLLTRLDPDGQPLASAVDDELVLSLAVSGSRLFVGTDGRLLVLDARTGGLLLRIPVAGAVPAVAVDPVQSRVFGVVSDDHRGDIVAWSTVDGRELARHPAPSTPNGKALPTSLALHAGSLWVTSELDELGTGVALERLTPDRLQPVDPGPLARRLRSGHSAVTVHSSATALWIRDYSDGTLTCIRPSTSTYVIPPSLRIPDTVSAVYAIDQGVAYGAGNLAVELFRAPQGC